MSSLDSLVRRYQSRANAKSWAPFQIAAMTVSFFAIGTVVVFYSLGYQLNWATHSIQQTGIIVIKSSSMSGGKVAVSLDDEALKGDFPFRQAHLFPDEYTVSLKRPGYQTWQHDFVVEPNKVVTSGDLVLIKDPVSLIPAKMGGSQSDVPGSSSQGIEIKGSELWVDGVFLTRLSTPIIAAEWYPDKTYVAYQTVNGLYLYDTVDRVTEALLPISTKEALPFGFQAGGQRLVYWSDGSLYKVNLYD